MINYIISYIAIDSTQIPRFLLKKKIFFSRDLKKGQPRKTKMQPMSKTALCEYTKLVVAKHQIITRNIKKLTK